MYHVKKKKSILDGPIAIPFVFKTLAVVIICVLSSPITLTNELAGILLFIIYPFDLLFSILILILNQREKPFNRLTLFVVILVPILQLGWIPANIFTLEVLKPLSLYLPDIGFWGGLLTIILITYDIIRFRLSSCALQPQDGIGKKKVNNKRLYTVFAGVACVLVLIISIPMFNDNSDFELPNSVGNVSVKYINKTPSVLISSSLVWRLTEEELFHKYNTDIFMGQIEDIRNIKIDFNGPIEYRAIAEIRIDKIFRGNGIVGETVSVLLPCSVDTNVLVEDTKVVSSMRVGMTGIFMPIEYDETSYREENGAKIYWRDIANYGFLDGERYAFLNSDNGLIFAEDAYQSITSAISLEEIEEFVIKMIE